MFLSGDAYSESIIPMQVIMPLLLVIRTIIIYQYFKNTVFCSEWKRKDSSVLGSCKCCG